MKLKLELDDLRVDTFDTAADEGSERGTVHGHDTRPGVQCATGPNTCYYSCEETCPLSCNPSCIATDAFCCPDS
ncbi:MAG TPA: hypothetical protein VFR37_20480 [Longimicrobium sp.]|nr:hypothetical protein [Longimicrobium sp.]